MADQALRSTCSTFSVLPCVRDRKSQSSIELWIAKDDGRTEASLMFLKAVAPIVSSIASVLPPRSLRAAACPDERSGVIQERPNDENRKTRSGA